MVERVKDRPPNPPRRIDTGERCESCREPIFAGQDIYLTPDGTVHEDCFSDWMDHKLSKYEDELMEEIKRTTATAH